MEFGVVEEKSIYIYIYSVMDSSQCFLIDAKYGGNEIVNISRNKRDGTKNSFSNI